MTKPWLYSLIISVGFSGAVCGEECRVQYGEVIAFDSCPVARLPDLTIQFKGISRPNPKYPIACWNYELSPNNPGTALPIEHCHTGMLGGNQDFTLGDGQYTIVFDLMRQCGPPWQRGHAIFKPALSEQALREFRERKENEERECFAKRMKPGQKPR